MLTILGLALMLIAGSVGIWRLINDDERRGWMLVLTACLASAIGFVSAHLDSRGPVYALGVVVDRASPERAPQ